MWGNRMDSRSRSLQSVVAAVLLLCSAVFVSIMSYGLGGFSWQLPQRVDSVAAAPGAPDIQPPVGIPVEYPSYAPNGREVVFNTFWPGKMETLAVSTIDGRIRTVVGEGPRDSPTRFAVHPAWSPNGKWIAFATEQAAGVRSNIWLVHPDGSDLTQLTKGSTHEDEPAWSPDGTRIAFTASADLGYSRNNIWIINADGSGLMRVTNGQQSWLPDLPREGYHPSFSPDGIQIVFSQGYSPNALGPLPGGIGNKLVVLNTDGTGHHQLTAGAPFDWFPAWSKRGILFNSPRFAGVGVGLIQPDGTGLQALPKSAGWHPTWSPDASKIAFVRAGDYVYNVSGYGIYEFDFADGTTRSLVQIRGYLLSIEIMPGASSKIVSLSGTPLIRVAVHELLPAIFQPGFDPKEHAAHSTVTFGRTGEEPSMSSCTVKGTNLVCFFKTELTGFRPGDRQGILRIVTGFATDPSHKVRFEGRGTLQIVP